MKGTIVSVCCGLFLLVLTSQIRDAAAAQTFGRGGVTAPNTDTCYYDGTTTTSDALIALTNNQENYAFIQFVRLPFILAISTTNIFGVPGLSSYLSTNGILGYAFQLSNRVYFLNFFGCPTLTYVSNSRDYVNGYDFLSGYQLYQAFAALNSPVSYSCSLCSSNDIASYVYNAAPGQGLNAIFVNQLQTFVVFQYGVSTSTLQSNIISTLRANNVSAIASASQGYVTVYDSKSVARPCVFPPIANFNTRILSSAVRNPGNFSGKRNICNLSINIAAVESTLDSFTTTFPLKLVLPLSDGKLIVISCYSLITLFDSIYLPLLRIC